MRRRTVKKQPGKEVNDMKHIAALKQQLAELGITLRCFDTARQAADYLDGAIDGVSSGDREFTVVGCKPAEFG